MACRNFTTPSLCIASQSARCLLQRRHYASDNGNKNVQRSPEEGKNFQTQLWDSAYQRVQKERAEQTRFGAKQRFGDGPGARIAGLIFGKHSSRR
jgi:hypothetical protein